MAERIADLRTKAWERGVPLTGVETKSQIEVKLANGWELEYPGDYLPQIPVMLAHDAKNISDDIVESMLNDKKWAIEIKYDGARFKMHVLNGQFHFDSRNRSVEDYHYKNRTNVLTHVLGLGKPPEELEDSVFDGELVFKGGLSGNLNKAVSVSNTDPLNKGHLNWAKGQVQYVIFDVLKLGGVDMTNEPFCERRARLINVISKLRMVFPSIKHSTIAYFKKTAMMDAWIQQGFEGVMFKNLEAQYALGKRVKEQLKLKRTLRFDAFVTGFKLAKEDRAFAGLIGAIEFSVNIEGLGIVPIAYCQPGTLEYRRQITEVRPFGNQLDASLYGRSAEIIGMNFTVNGFISHARIVAWNNFEGDFDQLQATTYKPSDPRFEKSKYFVKG